MPADKDGGGLDALLLGQLDNGLRLEERAAGAAQRAVGHDLDVMLFAQLDNLRLRQQRVILDLVDGGLDGGLGQELLEVLFAVLYTVPCQRRRSWSVCA